MGFYWGLTMGFNTNDWKMGVSSSENGVPQGRCLVYFRENPTKNGWWLGGIPLWLRNPPHGWNSKNFLEVQILGSFRVRRCPILNVVEWPSWDDKVHLWWGFECWLREIWLWSGYPRSGWLIWICIESIAFHTFKNLWALTGWCLGDSLTAPIGPTFGHELSGTLVLWRCVN